MKTGEIIQARIAKARTMLSRAGTIERGFTRRKTIISTLVITTGLYGTEGARVSMQMLHALDTAVLKCIWGHSKGSRAKEIILHLLLPGHRIAASMHVPYTRILWLAGLARRQLGAVYVAQAIWESTEHPSVRGPMGRALAEVRKLGWKPTSGWWAWEVPDQEREVHFVYNGPLEVGHVVRQSMRHIALAALEKRRPRQYAGLGWGPDRPTLWKVMETFKTERELSLVRHIVAGAVWTGGRANKRGLSQDAPCPYCGEGLEDEEHIFWVCTRWEETRKAWRPRVEELARAVPGIGGPCRQDWPVCTKMTALVPSVQGARASPGENEAVQAFMTTLLSQYVAILMERSLGRRAGLPVGQAAHNIGEE